MLGIRRGGGSNLARSVACRTFAGQNGQKRPPADWSTPATSGGRRECALTKPSTSSPCIPTAVPHSPTNVPLTAMGKLECSGAGQQVPRWACSQRVAPRGQRPPEVVKSFGRVGKLRKSCKQVPGEPGGSARLGFPRELVLLVRIVARKLVARISGKSGRSRPDRLGTTSSPKSELEAPTIVKVRALSAHFLPKRRTPFAPDWRLDRRADFALKSSAKSFPREIEG